MDDDWTNLTPEQRALLRGFWRAPKSVMINALHHEGLETCPGCPTISFLKARGLWMRGLGMYLGIGREMFVLAADPSPEALSKVMVRFEKTGGSWKLEPVG